MEYHQINGDTMPSDMITSFAKKIKGRKQFKKVKDKQASAEKYVDKKYKEAEDIVKKQYDKKDTPEGKWYGTITLITKNKIHLKESKFEKLYDKIMESINVV